MVFGYVTKITKTNLKYAKLVLCSAKLARHVANKIKEHFCSQYFLKPIHHFDISSFFVQNVGSLLEFTQLKCMLIYGFLWKKN